MTTSTLRKLFSKSALEEFWKTHRADFRSSPSAGVDGVTFKDFDARVESELAHLANEIAVGAYHQAHLRASFIRKDATRFRCINIPTIRDRVVQRVLLEHLRQRYRELLSEYPAYGVMRGQGTAGAIQHALRLTRSATWVTHFDIASFFDRVPRDHAAARIQATFPAPSLAGLLREPVFSETRLATKEQRQQFAGCGLTKGLGLRQGQPLSPLFACVYLKPLDEYASKKRWAYVRYVDDVVIFSNSRKEAEFRLAESKQLLQGLSIGLSDKPEKTFVRSTSQRFPFLGIDLLRRKELDAAILLPKGIQAGIQSDLKEKVDNLLQQRKPGAFVSLCQHLGSIRESYRPAYGACEDWPSLERELPSMSKAMIRKAVDVIRRGLERDAGDKDIERAAYWALGIVRT